jgi:hypothetical protein
MFASVPQPFRELAHLRAEWTDVIVDAKVFDCFVLPRPASAFVAGPLKLGPHRKDVAVFGEPFGFAFSDDTTSEG